MAKLIERETALQTLDEAYASAVLGHGRCVVLSGEAGIGKTQLLRHFASRILGGQTLWGRSDDLFTPNPLGPLRDMVPGLGETVGKLLYEDPSQERIFPAVLSVLQAAKAVTVLMFEDLHWADNATLDLVKYLARRVAYLPTLLVLSLRADETGMSHPVSKVIGDFDSACTLRIALPSLSVSGVAELVAGTGLVAEDVHRLTDGNPFFVTEIVAGHNQQLGQVPVSVRDVVWARLQRLSFEERDLLETISVSPSGAEDWLAEALWEKPARALLEALAAKGLLVPDVESKYRFRHELSRIATLNSLSADKQRKLHAVALATLRIRPSVGPTCLLHHASGAADSNAVLTIAPEAVKEAVAMGAHRVAVSHLETAIKHIEKASPEQAAQLYDEWAYEFGLVHGPTAAVIAATHQAIAAWRALQRSQDVARNLRRLSRLHWLGGESEQTQMYLDLAVAELDGEEPCRELAMAYAVRSQLLMFNDLFAEAVDWSQKAIELADKFSDQQTRCHALVNLGSSMLYMGIEDGKAKLEEALSLAVNSGFHEQAYRGFVNLSEYAVLVREFPLADRVLEEGIKFCSKHDLDVATYSLIGLSAQSHMEQGDYGKASSLAETVLNKTGLSVMSKIPAVMTAAKVAMRSKLPTNEDQMAEYIEKAFSTKEQQYILPALFGMVEMAWLDGDKLSCHGHLQSLLNVRLQNLAPWDVGQFAVWWRRCSMPGHFPLDVHSVAASFSQELNGKHTLAAKEWMKNEAPYDAALALLAGGEDLQAAADLLIPIKAERALMLARKLSREKGIALRETGKKRGPYRSSRQHPFGLTDKEQQVLHLLAGGLTNNEIAAQVFRSSRTVEHHVSAILAKYGASSRIELLLRMKTEPVAFLLENRKA